MARANLTQFKNPLSGQTGNLFNLVGLWQMVLGVIVVVFAWSAGTALFGYVRRLVPAVPVAGVKTTASGWQLAE